MACKTRPPACENSTGEVKGEEPFDKLKKIRKIILVGAPGFEPGTSCAQGRRATTLEGVHILIGAKRSLLENFAPEITGEIWLQAGPEEYLRT